MEELEVSCLRPFQSGPATPTAPGRVRGNQKAKSPPAPECCLILCDFGIWGLILWGSQPIGGEGTLACVPLLRADLEIASCCQNGGFGFVLVYENHLLYKYYLSGAEILFQKN